MKKILATLVLLLGTFHILSAVPAYPWPIRVTQPDGSVITIRIHGDEWFHYVTDDRGRVVARGTDGFYRPAEMPSAALRAEAARMREEAGRMRAQAAPAAKAGSMSLGTHRIPVILVAFQDTPFVIDDPRGAFDALLNEEGYSANGGTGSVHDFYYENSHGQYDPVFEVFGPYTLSKNSADYVNSAGSALVEACKALDGEIDFSRYDSDGDGYVDMTLMYYAGHNAAETGREEDQIWPHQGYAGGNTRLDGKRLYKYFCTSELKGYSGRSMCGIGTTTHEFAHSLGLPDFYDTDYATNGEAGGLYTYSTMCSGPYLNNGRTPPYFNSEELKMLGWAPDQTEISQQGTLTIEPVQGGVSYRSPTTTSGEYFVYECRAKTGWDRYLPSAGLLVYHVDKSQREVTIIQTGWDGQEHEYTYPAADLWNNWTYTNAINENAAHPCFYLVPAADQSNLAYGGGEANIPFPGNRRITSYNPVDWEGARTDFRFTDIAFSNNKVTMTVRYTSVPGVIGIVRNMSAKPVRGATVSLYEAGTASAPAAKNAIRRKIQGAALMSTTTDTDGSYSFEDASLADGTFTLAVTCDGYVESTATVQIGRAIEEKDFYIRKVDEPLENTFMKYDPEGASYLALGYGNTSQNVAAALRLTAEEATAYAGKQIKLISFQPSGSAESTAESAYVFIEVGRSRKFTQQVENVRFDAMNTVNVVGQEFYIPEGSEIYIGYGLVGCSEEYPVLVQPSSEENAGYMAVFSQNRANSWGVMQIDDAYYTPVISASVGEPVQPELGFNHIANPGNGTYAAGERFSLELVRYEDDTPSSVSWTFDGQAVQGDSVTLSAGTHAVEAHLKYPDGSVEVIRLTILAQ